MMSKLLVLNDQQMASLIHDYLADNYRWLSMSWNVTNETYTEFFDDKVKTLVIFSRQSCNFYIDCSNVIHKLPHTGFDYICLDKKQLQNIADNDLLLDDSNVVWGNKESFSLIKRKQVRVSVLDENDVASILHKQIAQTVHKLFDVTGMQCQVQTKLIFDGKDSQALCFLLSNNQQWDLIDIKGKQSTIIEGWGWQQFDLT